MANFNAQPTSTTIIELAEYGYTHLETIGTAPVTIYFEDTNKGVLKLIVDVTSQAATYNYRLDACWRTQEEVLVLSAVTDLASLDALLIPIYSITDPTLIKIEALTAISNRTVLVPGLAPYYTALFFTEPVTTFITHLVSEEPSPYRNRDLIWVPVTFNMGNWELTHNSAVIVNTSDVVNATLGDYIVVLPEDCPCP